VQNSFDFKATGGIGTRYLLNGASTDYIAGNIITDEAGGLTGMLFDNVAANTRIQIDGNTINLLATDLTTHQGIIFTSVTPTIQFTGTMNNLIYNAPTVQSLFLDSGELRDWRVLYQRVAGIIANGSDFDTTAGGILVQESASRLFVIAQVCEHVE